MIGVAATLVALGVSQWRNPGTSSNAFWRVRDLESREPGLRRGGAAFTIGLGVVVMVGVAVTLLTQPD
jgi:hypothetical protein